MPTHTAYLEPLRHLAPGGGWTRHDIYARAPSLSVQQAKQRRRPREKSSQGSGGGTDNLVPVLHSTSSPMQDICFVGAMPHRGLDFG